MPSTWVHFGLFDGSRESEMAMLNSPEAAAFWLMNVKRSSNAALGKGMMKTVSPSCRSQLIVLSDVNKAGAFDCRALEFNTGVSLPSGVMHSIWPETARSRPGFLSSHPLAGAAPLKTGQNKKTPWASTTRDRVAAILGRVVNRNPFMSPRFRSLKWARCVRGSAPSRPPDCRDRAKKVNEFGRRFRLPVEPTSV